MHLSPDQKNAGVLAPVFALRSKNDLGVGDVAGLRAFVDWSADIGIKVVQILPINETGGDSSPYNAISSVAIDVTTIDTSPAAISELTPQAYKRVIEEYDLEALREGGVDYANVKSLKHRLLAKAFTHFLEKERKSPSSRGKEFVRFREIESEWLSPYAIFRVLMERNHTEQWNCWPAEHSTPESAAEWLKAQPAKVQKEFETRVTYFKYVQWIAFSQWRAVKLHAESRGVALMGDVPFGVSYFSSDVYSDRESFVLDWSGGAPPEPYFKDDEFTQKWGQNWGIPLYNWDIMQGNNFRWWRQRVRMVREIFHIFRIDHVLGCYRIYAFPWRPEENTDFLALSHEEAAAKTGGRLPGFKPRDDSNPENCEANRQEGEALLKVLLEETGEFRLVGEDLGMVPDYVRPNLASLGIAGFKIPIWEREWHEELVRGEHYQRLSLATYGTHDHEPIRALWERWHASIVANDEAANDAKADMHRLMRYANLDTNHGWPELTPEIHLALLAALFRCNSWIASLMITDLFGSTVRFNVPGAVSTANWSNRLAIPVEDWKSDQKIGPLSLKVRDLLNETGRA
ncbi:MAG TPA: 4-alpha-glucanotransferase [Chthoniobacterales bacterium]